MKKFQTILLALGIGCFIWLLWKIGVHEMWHELALLGWGLLPLMLGEGIAEMIHTVGWRHCLSGPLRSLPWSTLFQIRMVGYALNYLTPTAALGGEVTKATLLASHHRGPEGASGVLIGKVCFAVAHLLFVILGAALVLWKLELPRYLGLGMLIGGALLAVGMSVFLLLQKHGKVGSVFRRLAARKPANHPLQKIAVEISAVDESMKCFYRERPLDFCVAILWHLVGYSVGIAQTWLFFRLLHHEAAWTVAAGVWFLGMWFDLLTFAIPLNLGTLEGTRIVALRALGYTAVMGLTYGFALRMAQIFWSCFGLGIHALMVARLSGTPAQRAKPNLSDRPSSSQDGMKPIRF